MDKQKTISKEVTIKGVGLHTGSEVTLIFKPAAADTGIIFVRTDISSRPEIKVGVGSLTMRTGSLRCNYIGKDDSSIQTVEHLLAALSGLGINNIRVEIDGSEVPGFDGSSAFFYETFSKAGITQQDKDAVPIAVKEPIVVREGGASIMALPAPEFRVSYTLCYDHPMLKDFMEMTVTADSFSKELAGARTFCLEDEVAKLKSLGFGKGANYDNTLVLGASGVIKNKLRFDNEFVRHKILDLIGDLYVLGRPVAGHII
ncbi:MAG: UDP-3-O-acyl-N-acetylglucosamine deacetylase, partial [Candidatus Omnitrophica bacterium]|nr:UDP-3-O-acyl-N-acetylglucosamine deacetylase [Candidatus Omnitrophota bacterium]